MSYECWKCFECLANVTNGLRMLTKIDGEWQHSLKFGRRFLNCSIFVSKWIMSCELSEFVKIFLFVSTFASIYAMCGSSIVKWTNYNVSRSLIMTCEKVTQRMSASQISPRTLVRLFNIFLPVISYLTAEAYPHTLVINNLLTVPVTKMCSISSNVGSQIKQIGVIFIHLKLWVAVARHNFKWAKI